MHQFCLVLNVNTWLALRLGEFISCNWLDLKAPTFTDLHLWLGLVVVILFIVPCLVSRSLCSHGMLLAGAHCELVFGALAVTWAAFWKACLSLRWKCTCGRLWFGYDLGATGTYVAVSSCTWQVAMPLSQDIADVLGNLQQAIFWM